MDDPSQHNSVRYESKTANIRLEKQQEHHCIVYTKRKWQHANWSTTVSMKTNGVGATANTFKQKITNGSFNRSSYVLIDQASIEGTKQLPVKNLFQDPTQ